MAECYDVAIIGGGVAGFGAAMYAGRFELKTLVLAAMRGGAIINTDLVENYPGFESIGGFELAEKLMKHAEKFGAQVKDERVEKVERCKDGCFSVVTGAGSYCAKTVIFATGSEWRKLGVPGEKEFANRGVHYCALCDGAFYKGKVIGVVGGGNGATKAAMLLSNFGSKVHVFVRGDRLKADPVNIKKIEANPKIAVHFKVNVKEVKGAGKVMGVMLDKEIGGLKELKLDAVFVEIGQIPLSGLAKELGVKLNEKGEIMSDRQARTSVEGIYAAGDVVDTAFKQAITGVSEGVLAAYSAYRHLEDKPFKCTCKH